MGGIWFEIKQGLEREEEGIEEEANSKRNKMGKKQVEDRNGIYKREDGEGI